MEYLATVEQFFVVLRRSGLMLSARDVLQVEEWQQAGIPVEVVCRGLARGAERYRATQGQSSRLPSTLRYYQSAVEDTVQERRDLVDIEPPTPMSSNPEVDPLAELAFIGQSESDPRKRNAYRAAWRAMKLAGDLTDPTVREEALDSAHDTAIESMLSSLVADERAHLDRRVEEKLALELDGLGVQGARIRRQVLLEDELSSCYGLVRLRERLE